MKYNLILAEEDVKTFFKLEFENLFEIRREDLIHFYKEDNYYSSGYNDSKSVDETIAIKLADDVLLKRYKRILRDVRPIYQELAELPQNILKTYYTDADDKKHKRLTDEEVSDVFGLDISACRRVRKDFIKEVAKKRYHLIYS